MKLLILLTCIVLVFAVAGCQSGGCIKIGGSYGEAGGSVEYCFDAEQTIEIGLPVMVEKGEEGTEPKEYFGFSEDDINKIIEQIRGVAALSVEDKKPAVVLKELLIK